MKTLIVGSGGREDALGWACANSWNSTGVYVAPGNGGTARFGTRVPIDPKDQKSFEALSAFCHKENIELVIVGPDGPLAGGLVDYLEATGLRVVGPTRAAAELEWSKAFGKRFMQGNRISTAPFRVFGNHDAALEYALKRKHPLYIKADGLALGKGAKFAKNRIEVKAILRKMMIDREFGPAGDTVVIEECLEGTGIKEFSAHALCDRNGNYILFPMSKDHKTIGEGDTGLNTGGMGVICPAFVPPKAVEEVTRVIDSTLLGMRTLNRPYTGILYPGFMQTKKGYMLLEYNARGGDPEMQAYMRLLQIDALDLFEKCADGALNKIRPSWFKGAVAVLTLAARGYPGKPETGHVIRGVDEADRMEGVVVFRAGVQLDGGSLYTSGGRVLSVTATGKHLPEALNRAYEAADRIAFEGKVVRRDIGRTVLNLPALMPVT